jgi:hypothetical protein
MYKTHINFLAFALSIEHGAMSAVFNLVLSGLTEDKVVREEESEEEKQTQEERTILSSDPRSSERMSPPH